MQIVSGKLDVETFEYVCYLQYVKAQSNNQKIGPAGLKPASYRMYATQECKCEMVIFAYLHQEYNCRSAHVCLILLSHYTGSAFCIAICSYCVASCVGYKLNFK